MPATPADIPLAARFPGVRAIPRVALCTLPTPVDAVPLAGGRTLLVKRDDLSASPIGGNKPRGLEWLLGGVRAGDRIVTVGPRGSNHALATSVYARRLGARVTVFRWPQHMSPVAIAVDAALRREEGVVDTPWLPVAYARAFARRARGDRWIPAGGASPLAILGHVNAGLELADQIERGDSPKPDVVFVPLGTGGTAAGLVLGLRIAELDVPVVAVRVVPRIVGRARRVAALANAAARLLERHAGVRVPRVSASDVRVDHSRFGGEYGRPLPDASVVAGVVAAAGIRLDDTYSTKACAAALASTDARPMLWLTFDARALQNEQS